jgi:hypothetical protein
MKRGFFLFALLLLWPALAPAAEFKVGDIVVIDPWARASAGANGVVGAYLTVRNDGDQADRLVGAVSDNAEQVQLHVTRAQGQVMRMLPVESIDIPAHGAVTLQPGGYHLMVMGLKEPLRVGARLPLTLKFERAGALAVYAAVVGPGGMGPMAGAPGMMSGHEGMSGMSGMAPHGQQ